MATPANWDQFNEDMRRWQELAEDMALKYKGLVSVADSGQLAALAFIANLSSAPIGELAALQQRLQVQHVAGRETVGDGARILREGAGGVLGNAESVAGLADANSRGSRFISADVNGHPIFSTSFTTGFLSRRTTNRWFALGGRTNGNSVIISARAKGSDAELSPEVTLYHTSNSTVDSNGFLKAASPIFRLANTAEAALADGLNFVGAGAGAANDEALGVTASHDELGVYTIHGSLGFATEGWTIEVPQDANGNRLCFVETEQADDGTITVRTFSRKFDFEAVAIVAGDPMDIPGGRWIDLRLSMPEPEQPDEPKPEQADAA